MEQVRNGLLVASALVLAVLICLSRLYVGVHFPTDVLVGAAVGIALSALSTRALRRIFAGKAVENSGK